jgi:hypothetical protein
MADNLYDYLNRFNLAQLGRAGERGLQGAADFLNRARIGTGGAKKSQTPKRPEGYSTYGTYTVGGIEYDIAKGRPTYMPPGSVYPSTSTAATTASVPADPAERAYVAERARVAQQVAQDPALSQYERNRAAAVATGDQAKMNAVRDEGMRIWAEKNPELAKKVKPGQSGYEAIQGVLNQGAMGAPMEIPFNPVSLLGGNAIESVPSYGGISDLQPVGTPLPRTQFDTPQNQATAQMYNRFMTGPYAGSSQAPATNPAEATYATAANVQPIGDINLNAFSFNTPAEKRRGELFQRLLNNTLAVQ